MIYEDEAGLTEKPEDTRYIKKLHQKKTRNTGSAGKGTWSQLCHYWDCGLGESAGASSLMAPSGVWNVPARWRLQPGLILWFPPDPRRRLSTFLNLSWWKGHCYHYKICNNGTQGGDGDPSFQVHPLRHPVAILVHYVIFISIHLNMLLFMFILHMFSKCDLVLLRSKALASRKQIGTARLNTRAMNIIPHWIRYTMLGLKFSSGNNIYMEKSIA